MHCTQLCCIATGLDRFYFRYIPLCNSRVKSNNNITSNHKYFKERQKTEIILVPACTMQSRELLVATGITYGIKIYQAYTEGKGDLCLSHVCSSRILHVIYHYLQSSGWFFSGNISIEWQQIDPDSFQLHTTELKLLSSTRWWTIENKMTLSVINEFITMRNHTTAQVNILRTSVFSNAGL